MNFKRNWFNHSKWAHPRQPTLQEMKHQQHHLSHLQVHRFAFSILGWLPKISKIHFYDPGVSKKGTFSVIVLRSLARLARRVSSVVSALGTEERRLQHCELDGADESDWPAAEARVFNFLMDFSSASQSAAKVELTSLNWVDVEGRTLRFIVQPRLYRFAPYLMLAN